MSRSSKKGPFVDPKLLSKVVKQKSAGKERRPIKTWARRCTVIPEFVGHKFDVYNGKSFVEILVTEEMVGHKLGEFSPSRQFRQHAGAKKEEPKRR